MSGYTCLLYIGRKECRGTLFPAHYKGNDVINSVILSTPLLPSFFHSPPSFSSLHAPFFSTKSTSCKASERRSTGSSHSRNRRGEKCSPFHTHTLIPSHYHHHSFTLSLLTLLPSPCLINPLPHTISSHDTITRSLWKAPCLLFCSSYKHKTTSSRELCKTCE